MRNLKLLLAAMLFSQAALGSTVAIIDSGTDMLHKDIDPQAWINPFEVARNDVDEDQNGYPDDVHGWNFAEQNRDVIDYQYLGRLTADVRRFFDIQTKGFYGQATDEDRRWVREKLSDQEFIKQLQVYGNFMHGTHVAGIAIKGSTDARVMAVKLIPTEVKLPFYLIPGEGQKNFGMTLLKAGLGFLAKQQMQLLEQIADYVNGHKVDVANGSFGTGYPQASMIVKALAGTILRREPTDEEVDEAAKHFLNALIKEGDHMVQRAENTLFVFAAGNDGLNNDEFPTSPTNIQAENVISVAATLDNSDIAPFSNYGKGMVDVAAPGVGIESAVPGNQWLKVSGTSQAAPYVANVASQIKDANKDLSPRLIKKIIMKTVDLRDYLKGKVVTNGIVNTARAVQAAVLSRTLGLDEAIAEARATIADQATTKSAVNAGDSVVLPLPSMFEIK